MWLLACVKIVFVENIDDGWIDFNFVYGLLVTRPWSECLSSLFVHFPKRYAPFVYIKLVSLCRVLYSVSDDSI